MGRSLEQHIATVAESVDGSTLDDAIAARRTIDMALLTTADLFAAVAEHDA